eukprot:TRINITY_DN647_c0_g1_i4.p1 TRINITY_DN647_c0_g1~~TRINITY_DN647_c0_g1_i4.p1  ORF type:complete len:301 (-),score=72.81 TRINITY_DN647_c0_g1_i4:384-1286(-)
MLLLPVLQAGCFFAEKAFMLGKRNTITATALLAALICVVYTTWELAYFYAGLMAQPDTCKTATAWGVLRSISNALAFLHLFLRADVANSINPHWHMWRRVGIALTVINWALLIVAPALRRITLIPTKLGARCSAQYESVSFTLMWVSQLVCHIAFTLMFVYPLVRHMNELKQSTADSALEAGVAARGSSRDDDVYRTLVRRAVGALALSATFTVLVTILVLLQEFGDDQNVPTVGLSVLDNGVTLASICFANSGGLIGNKATHVQLPPQLMPTGGNTSQTSETATEARSSSVLITPARYS